MFINKKAVAGFTLQMIISITIMLTVALVIAGIVYVHSNIPIDAKQATADMFVARLMLGEDGITKYDPITGVIDPSTVTKKRLLAWDNKTIQLGNRLAAVIKIDTESVSINKKLYERINPLLQFELNKKLKNRGSYSVYLPEGLYLYRYPVVYEGETKNELDTLQIRVVVTDE